MGSHRIRRSFCTQQIILPLFYIQESFLNANYHCSSILLCLLYTVVYIYSFSLSLMIWYTQAWISAPLYTSDRCHRLSLNYNLSLWDREALFDSMGAISAGHQWRLWLSCKLRGQLIRRASYDACAFAWFLAFHILSLHCSTCLYLHQIHILWFPFHFENGCKNFFFRVDSRD